MKIKVIAFIIFFTVFSIHAQESGPDLSCPKIEITNKEIKVNSKLIFKYVIYNQGDKKAKAPYDVALYVNDSLVSYSLQDKSLKPKAGIGFSKHKEGGYYHFKPKKSGEYRYKVIIDSINQVKELDEKNNIIEGTFFVRD